MKYHVYFFIFLGLFLSNFSIANAGARPDAHAPIGVMGDHTHHKGEFMLSYRYMSMHMDGNRSGNNRLSTTEVLAGGGNTGSYLVAPLDMDMDMHMFGLMYAPNHRLTLMAMVNVIDLTMDHQVTQPVQTMLGIDSEFTTESDGLGDTVISGIYKLSETDKGTWLLNLGLSIPTGSIDEKDIIPTLSTTERSQLPFPMQLGSGTYDLLPGLTYTNKGKETAWGAQTKFTLRLDDNDNGYSKGNQGMIQAWHSWLLSHSISTSTRIAYTQWGDYSGPDSQQNLPIFNSGALMGAGANTVPTVNPNLRAGKRADFAVGINTLIGDKGHRIAAELAKPVYQELDGPQLETDWHFTLGYQIAF